MFTVFNLITSRSIRDDVVIADARHGSHDQWLDNSFVEEFVIRFAGDFMDEHAEQKIVGVAVIPFVAERKFDGQRLDLRYEFVFREIEPHIGRTLGTSAILGFVLGEARGMGKKILNQNGVSKVRARRGSTLQYCRRAKPCRPQPTS